MQLSAVVATLAFVNVAAAVGIRNSAERIAGHGYPVETHLVQTSDGYLLSIYRIPYSPKLQNQNESRPVAYLQHGLLGTSDNFLLNGPDNALAFLLTDAGYDVWLGNSRGNTYSRKNVHRSPISPSFWRFSWHEIAIYDVTATIDYVLAQTNHSSLHYVGHSQGTTVFFVLMSTIPSYNAKIKTAHMLAPSAYQDHMRSPVKYLLIPGYQYLGRLFDCAEFLANNELFSLLQARACSDNSVFPPICADVFFLIGGWDSENFNYTLLPDVMQTYPAGSSSCQVAHYFQGYKSTEFRQYDFGEKMNVERYGQSTPPNYVVENITAPLWLYYGNNDLLVDPADVLRLADRLPNLVDLYNVPVDKWNHFDFLFALNCKEMIYDRLIDACNHFEHTGGQLLKVI